MEASGASSSPRRPRGRTPARGSTACTRATGCRWSSRSSTSTAPWRPTRRSSPIHTGPRPASSTSFVAPACPWWTSPRTSAFTIGPATSTPTAQHGAPELLGDAVYGLPELHREAIRGRRLVANPGCYPTAALLALAPLAEAGLAEDMVISAASGVSGAGRGGGERVHFVAVDENFSPYGVDGHRHAPEIDQELRGSGRRRRPRSSPTCCRSTRACWRAATCGPARELGEEELRSLYRERYADEPFVEVVDEPPGVRDVRDTNLCRVHVALDGRRQGAGLRGDRQPLEGGRGPGDPEPEPDAGAAGDGGARMTASFARGG